MITHGPTFQLGCAVLCLLALVVGASCHMKSESERDRERLNYQIQNIKAGSSDSIQLYDMHDTDASVRGIVGLGGVKWLILSQTNVTDAGIADVAAFPELKRLTFHNLRVQDQWLERLASCPKLEELELCPRNYPVTFHVSKALALPHLRKLKLEIFVYRGDDEDEAAPQTADSILADLEQATSLEELELDGPGFENRKPALVALQQKLPHCRISLLSRVGNQEVPIPVTSFDEP